MMRSILVATTALVLVSCSTATTEKPVGIGSGRDEYKRSPCACIPVQQVPPDTRTAALIALLHALQCEDKIVDSRQHGLSKHELRARAQEIAKGNWASQAVRSAIEEMMAAIVTATTAATMATTASAG